MIELLSRRTLMKIAGAATAGLAIDALWLVPVSAASFDNVSATIDLNNTTLDHLTIKADFNGISQTLNPNALRIQLRLENLDTGELATFEGPPTRIK
jgi:hypothetical protein